VGDVHCDLLSLQIPSNSDLGHIFPNVVVHIMFVLLEERLKVSNLNLRVSAFLKIVVVLALSFLFGCGGGSNVSSSPQPAQPGATSVQINLGDGPSDWIVSFTMNMSSMTLTNTSGGAVSVASGSMEMEMRHLMGTMQALVMVNVPQGTYSMANINIISASVTYIDPVTKQPVQKTMPGMTKTINFNPSVTVGSTPMTMNFELDLSQSVSADPSGTMTFSPFFNVTTGSPGGGQGPQFGGLDHTIGTVAGISGNSLTMSMMQSLSNITVMTNSSTQFENMSGMGSMSTGMMIEVDAVMQSDGSLMATRIDSVLSGMSGGLMAEGLVNSITGNPLTQLTIIADNGAGSGMMSTVLGTALPVNITSATSYSFDGGGVDLNNLPFMPAFNSSSIAKGQRVDPGSTGGMMGGGMMGGGAINASEVTLEQQGLSGMVANYAGGSPASFILSLPADCAFTSITGAGTITVYQQPDTRLRGMTSVSNGASVQVRGLLFFDAGTYKLVATTIMPH